MRNLLKHRQQGEGTPLRRRVGSIFDTPTNHAYNDTSKNFIRSVDVLVIEADKDLTKAIKNQDTLQAELVRLAEDFKHRAIELERTKLELQNSKRQCELVKSLLADATAEKDIMYEVGEPCYSQANVSSSVNRHLMRNWTGCTTMPICLKMKHGGLCQSIFETPRKIGIISQEKIRKSAFVNNLPLLTHFEPKTNEAKASRIRIRERRVCPLCSVVFHFAHFAPGGAIYYE